MSRSISRLFPFSLKPSPAARTYTAQPGDTLVSVAQKMLGDGSRWPELQALNKQLPAGPRLLTPGTVLKLPAKTAAPEPAKPAPAPEPEAAQPTPTQPAPAKPEPAPSAPAPAQPSPAAPKTYTVQPGDTLYGIAKKTLGDGRRFPEIQALNQDILPDANTIKVGMVLKLPTGAEAPPATPPATPPVATPPVATPPVSPSKPKPTPRPGEAVQGLFYNDRFEKQVALTFDDGPHPVNTPKVLDILKEYGVKGTFFVTGANAERYPDLIKRIVAEGHTLGNHTFAHPDLAKLSEADVLNELSRTQRAVDKALGKHYELEQVRPPYGSMDAEVKSAISKGDDTAILWNVDSNDWRYKEDDAKILDNIFSGSSSVYVRGGVILFHDIHPQTVRVLDDVIARLQKERFTITKTDDFLGQKYSK